VLQASLLFFQGHLRLQHSKTEYLNLRACMLLPVTCRFTEGTSINLSLLMLGSVVSKLADGRRSDQFIPYRNSKLTRLLQVCASTNLQSSILAPRDLKEKCVLALACSFKLSNCSPSLAWWGGSGQISSNSKPSCPGL